MKRIIIFLIMMIMMLGVVSAEYISISDFENISEPDLINAIKPQYTGAWYQDEYNDYYLEIAYLDLNIFNRSHIEYNIIYDYVAFSNSQLQWCYDTFNEAVCNNFVFTAVDSIDLTVYGYTGFDVNNGVMYPYEWFRNFFWLRVYDDVIELRSIIDELQNSDYGDMFNNGEDGGGFE